jgi:hypothetical protein
LTTTTTTTGPGVDARGNPVPAEFDKAGRLLWCSVADKYEMAVHEQLVLLQACRCADRLDRLDADARAGMVTVENFKGDQVAHPSMVEARQQSIVLTRLLASLRLPEDLDEPAAAQQPSSSATGRTRRPQRRGSARGSYQPRPLTSVPSA